MLKKKKKSKNGVFGKSWSSQNQFAIENVINVCLSFIEEKGLNSEGIFRLCGLKTNIDQWKELIDQDPMNFGFESSTDVHEVTGLLKLFLREMPNPLLTYELYDAFIAAAGIEFVQERPVIIKKCLELLPPLNRTIFYKICILLNKIMKNSEINKMNADNLATCIVPNVLKPQSDDITILINDAALQCTLVSSIIANVQKYFQSGPWVEEEVIKSVNEIPADLEPIISAQLPPENLCATLTVRYKQKQEKDRGKLQGLFELPEEPSNESIPKIEDDEKVSFSKRIEFFEEMVQNGGLEISPEYGAKVAALKRKALQLSTPGKKKKKDILKEIAGRKTSTPPALKEKHSKDEKLQNELNKAMKRKNEKKKKND